MMEMIHERVYLCKVRFSIFFLSPYLEDRARHDEPEELIASSL